MKLPLFRVVDALPAWGGAALAAGLAAAACWIAWAAGLAPGGHGWWWPAAGLAFGLGHRWGWRWAFASAAGAAACAALVPVGLAQALGAALGVALGSAAGLTVLGVARDLRPASDLPGETRRTLAVALLVAMPVQATVVTLAAAWAGERGLAQALQCWMTAWLAGAVGAATVAPLVPSPTSTPMLELDRRAAAAAVRRAALAACALAGAYAALAGFGLHAHARAAWLGLVPLAAACAAGAGSRASAALLVGAALGMQLARGAIEQLAGAPAGPSEPAAGLEAAAALLCAGLVAQWMHALAAERREALARLPHPDGMAASADSPGLHELLDALSLAAALNACLAVPGRGGLGLIGIRWTQADATAAGRCGPAAAPVAGLLVRHPQALLVACLAPGCHAMVLAADSVAQVRAVARDLYARLEATDAADTAACIGGLLIEPQASIDADDGLGALTDAIAIAGSVRESRLFVEPLSQSMIDARRAHRDKVERAREAIHSARLELHAQPLDNDGRAGGPIEYEILTRLRDRDGSLIAPAEFLALAAQTRESAALDRAVIEQVFAWLAAHPQALARTGTCSINLADATLGDPTIAAYAHERGARHGIPGDKIVFELTEGGVLRDPAGASRLVDELKAAGFGVALDDFGRGLATFEYLRRFPLDYVKIDGAFIRNLATSPIDEEIVRATIRVARRLQVRTVAEHVHSNRVLDKLRELGVDHVQGMLVGAPRPLHELFGLAPAAGGEPASAWAKPAASLPTSAGAT